MTTYLIAIHLVVDVDATNPRAEIAALLDRMLTSAQRQNAGPHAGLLDWAVAGDDLAASIVPVSLPAGYQPDVSDFPCWPQRRAMRG